MKYYLAPLEGITTYVYRNVLFKMKELWFYMISLFDDAEKIAKKIKKTERLKEYETIINTLFTTCDLRKD